MIEKIISPDRNATFLECNLWKRGSLSIATQLSDVSAITPPIVDVTQLELAQHPQI
jgi:hypothetical protein